MNLFESQDYKSFLKWKIKLNEKTTGYKGALAEASGCQRSYFSRVLNGHEHLTPDHAFGLCRFWKLTPLERDYFLELVHLARAGTPHLKNLILERIGKLKNLSQDLSERFQKKEPIDMQNQILYYSSWHWAAIHIALTLPDCKTAQALSKKLGLNLEFIEDSLIRLIEMGLVLKEGDHFKASQNSIHLPKTSPLMFNHLLNWRTKAGTHSQLGEKDSIHYTAIHSLSKKDFKMIQEMLLKAIDRSRAIVDPSPEETLACMNLDWFLL